MTTTPTPSGGGMPGWLKIVLVLLILVVLGCCGGFVACHFVCAAAGQALNNAMPSITNAATQKIADLTTQKLNQQGVNIDTSGQGLALPADFPTDIPVASGFKVRTKVVPPGGKGGTMNLVGADAPSALGAYYEKEMPKQGWSQIQSATGPNSFSQSYTKDKRGVTLMGISQTGETTLQITYTLQP